MMLIQVQCPFWLQTPSGSVNFNYAQSVEYDEQEEKIAITLVSAGGEAIFEFSKAENGNAYMEMKEQLLKAGFIWSNKNKQIKLAVPTPGEN